MITIITIMIIIIIVIIIMRMCKDKCGAAAGELLHISTFPLCTHTACQLSNETTMMVMMRMITMMVIVTVSPLVMMMNDVSVEQF